MSQSLTTGFLLFDRLACSAFEAVFQRRQTRFRDLLRWLEGVKKEKALRAQAAELRRVVERNRR
jgi:type II secretory pathway component PulM